MIACIEGGPTFAHPLRAILGIKEADYYLPGSSWFRVLSDVAQPEHCKRSDSVIERAGVQLVCMGLTMPWELGLNERRDTNPQHGGFPALTLHYELF